MIRILILIPLLFFGIQGLSQQQLLPIEHFLSGEVQRSVASTDSLVPTGMQPYIQSRFNLDHVYGYEKDSLTHYYLLTKKLLSDHLIVIDKPDFYITIDPLFDWHAGVDFSDTTEYRDQTWLRNNTRGFRVQGDLGKKFSFHTSFRENQSFVPYYQKAFIDSFGVMPGQGRVKAFEDYGFDFAHSYGWISYTPAKFINLQFGHNKNFIGHGYRSMLWSDASFNYPQLKVSLDFYDHKLQYTTSYSTLHSLDRLPLGEVPESLFQPKAASFHYLSFMPHSRVELGFFESVIWQTWDSTGTQPFDYRSFIPVIGVNTLLIGHEKANKVSNGVLANLKATDWLHVYGQFMYDGKTAYQLGIKSLSLGIKNLDLRFEYNHASSNTYQGTEPLQNYAHNNQSLAHPLGTGFDEYISQLRYRRGRWMGTFQFNYQEHDQGPRGNIFSSASDELTNPISQQSITRFYKTEAMYLVNAFYNFQIFASWIYRYQSYDIGGHETSYLSFGIRSSIQNKYFDF